MNPRNSKPSKVVCQLPASPGLFSPDEMEGFLYCATQKSKDTRKAYRSLHRKERAAYNKDYRARHPAETIALRRAYRMTHEHVQRSRDLRVRFGLSVHEFEALLAAQGGVCVICKKANWRKRRPHVDHDHASGKIRGILCFNCNGALGHIHDNPEILRAMINYLKDSA